MFGFAFWCDIGDGGVRFGRMKLISFEIAYTKTWRKEADDFKVGMWVEGRHAHNFEPQQKGDF